jgi:hypothetical protein
MAGAGREPNPIGELGDRQPPVGLQLSKDRAVYSVRTERLLLKFGIWQRKWQALIAQ